MLLKKASIETNEEKEFDLGLCVLEPKSYQTGDRGGTSSFGGH